MSGVYDFDFVGSQFDGSFPDPNHEGHDGWRADQILTSIGGWLVAYQPDVVLLHIGTNDITQGNQDANEVNDILDVIDDYEDASEKDVTVILALIINRRTYSPATTQYNIDVNYMAQNRIANGDDIIIVDMESALNYTTDMYDNLHPNDNGYIKMATVWYNALVGYFGTKALIIYSTDNGNVTVPGEGVFRYDPNAVVNLITTPDVNCYFVNWTGTAVNAGKVANPDSEITTVFVDDDYALTANFAQNGENELIEIDHSLELRADGTLGDFTDFYKANGWTFDTAKDFAFKVDFHYSDVSASDGWIGVSVGDDANYVSISVGSDSNASYFYYEAVVDGNIVMEQEPRTSEDGMLYVSFDAATKKYYLSHTGFGSGNAYVWQASNPTQGQWSLAVDVSVGGGSAGAAIGPAEAYIDNFEMQKGSLLGWPPVTDIDGNGFIELEDLAEMCENWLESGPGDIDDSGIVDLYDFAEFGPAW